MTPKFNLPLETKKPI